jgi:hypothetical protein
MALKPMADKSATKPCDCQIKASARLKATTAPEDNRQLDRTPD